VCVCVCVCAKSEYVRVCVTVFFGVCILPVWALCVCVSGCFAIPNHCVLWDILSPRELGQKEAFVRHRRPLKK